MNNSKLERLYKSTKPFEIPAEYAFVEIVDRGDQGDQFWRDLIPLMGTEPPSLLTINGFGYAVYVPERSYYFTSGSYSISKEFDSFSAMYDPIAVLYFERCRIMPHPGQVWGENDFLKAASYINFNSIYRILDLLHRTNKSLNGDLAYWIPEGCWLPWCRDEVRDPHFFLNGVNHVTE